QYGRHASWQPGPPPRSTHRRIANIWALPRKRAPAVPIAPFGLRATQKYADAELEIAAAIAAAMSAVTRKRLMIASMLSWIIFLDEIGNDKAGDHALEGSFK